MKTSRGSRAESPGQKAGNPAPASCPRLSALDSRLPSGAFTLLEVMIAGGILFMCLFAILALVANGLRNARALQVTKGDPRGSIASEVYFELTRTNTLSEHSASGQFEDYTYNYELREIETNGLCEVDIVVGPSSRAQAGASTMQMVIYLPQIQRRPGT